MQYPNYYTIRTPDQQEEIQLFPLLDAKVTTGILANRGNI